MLLCHSNVENLTEKPMQQQSKIHKNNQVFLLNLTLLESSTTDGSPLVKYCYEELVHHLSLSCELDRFEASPNQNSFSDPRLSLYPTQILQIMKRNMSVFSSADVQPYLCTFLLMDVCASQTRMYVCVYVCRHFTSQFTQLIIVCNKNVTWQCDNRLDNKNR